MADRPTADALSAPPIEDSPTTRRRSESRDAVFSLPPGDFPTGPLASVLGALRVPYPPHRVVHVGAGAGHGDVHVWKHWHVPCGVWIDADAQRMAWAHLPALAQQQHVVCATLSQTACEASFYTASIPEADGLLPPQRLTPIWSHVRTKHSRTHSTQPLDAVLQQTLGAPECSPATLPSGWLLLDCLPALDILLGAGETLRHTTLVCARWCEVDVAESDPLHGARLAPVRAALAERGLVLAAIIPGAHPRMGHAVFVRAAPQPAAPSAAIAGQATAPIAAPAAPAAASSESPAVPASPAPSDTPSSPVPQDIARRIEALTRENTALLAQRAALQKSLEEQTRLCTEEDTIVAGLRTQLEEAGANRMRLVAENAELSQTHAQLAKRLESQAQEAGRTQESLSAKVASLAAQRDEQTRLAQEYQNKMDALQHQWEACEERHRQNQAQQQESHLRQQQLQEELLKAEAQIELIKDLLLRDTGL
ncbi:FkbM family methyltransferase [Candidatus Symbiobacter mobilis]|uniref:FkbM-family methyltransferase n=1 Tax=Candidatus Symbiobacter mobilis CR TaxID=946483 RepID=U5NE36_9BURK|nr:FkbM family methyltransferase [Candidatus Symbiobacter mobilis]AGX88389.1 FkbM-family methyltransferase [Candidatus Symbiobacter mobilis CR]